MFQKTSGIMNRIRFLSYRKNIFKSINVNKNVRLLHCKGISDQFESLAVFPEWQIQSAGSLRRVCEVVESTVGKESLMHTAALIRLAEVYRNQGLYDDALGVLNFVNTTNEENGGKLYASITRAGIHLRQNKVDEALIYSKIAVDLCEKQNQDTMDVSAFSHCYGAHGLALLCAEDYSEATEFLQMAARWAEGPVDTLAALGNLGALHWKQCKLPENKAVSGGNAPIELSSESESHLTEATAYWEEALQSLQSHATSNMATNLCGPGSQDEVRTIPTKGDENENNNETKDTPLEVQLAANPELAALYAHTLCNLSLAYNLRGQQEQCSDHLSSALKALKPQEDAQHNQAQDAGFHTSAALGRVLGLTAAVHASGLQAVSAEGLYRSSLDLLRPLTNDIRYKQELSKVLITYADLVQKWEKREHEADQLRLEEKELGSKKLSTIGTETFIVF